MAIKKDFTVGAQAAKLIGTNIVKAEVLIDFESVPGSANDVYEAIKIPAYAKVMEVHTVIKTAEGSALTMDLGDGTDPNGWDDAVNGNAGVGANTRSTPGTDDLATGGKFYVADDTIDVTIDNDADTGAVVVMAIYMISEKYV